MNTEYRDTNLIEVGRVVNSNDTLLQKFRCSNGKSVFPKDFRMMVQYVVVWGRGIEVRHNNHHSEVQQWLKSEKSSILGEVEK